MSTALERPTDNLQAPLYDLEEAYKGRKASAIQGAELYGAAAKASLAFGLCALTQRSLQDLDIAIKAFLKWRDRARRDKQTAAFKQAVQEFKEGLASETEKERFDEFMVGARLGAIKDPFKRWVAVGKEISKHWPNGVSAVDVIREQRRW